METVTVSPKYQIVIPRSIRTALKLKPGEKMQAIRYGDRVELIPQRSINKARGSLKGLDTHIEREPDRL